MSTSLMLSFGPLILLPLTFMARLTSNLYSRRSFSGSHFTPRTLSILPRRSGSLSPEMTTTLGLKETGSRILEMVPSVVMATEPSSLVDLVTFPLIFSTSDLDPPPKVSSAYLRLESCSAALGSRSQFISAALVSVRSSMGVAGRSPIPTTSVPYTDQGSSSVILQTQRRAKNSFFVVQIWW